jgi:tetratricopeptide (TPR) repeat protein
MLVVANLLSLLAVAVPIGQAGSYGIHGYITLEGATSLEAVPVRLETVGARYVATTYTNSAGAFEFLNVPMDTYNVIVKVNGFDETRERVTLPQGTGLWLFVKHAFNTDPNAEASSVGGRHKVDLRQLGIPEDAVREFEKAREDAQDNDVDSAMNRLHRALEIAPQFYEAVVELARLQIGLREYGAAIKVLGSQVPEDSQIPGADFYLGYALYYTGNYEAAETALLESIESKAGFPAARLMLANVIWKRWNASQSMLRETLCEPYPEAFPLLNHSSDTTRLPISV